MPSGSEKAEVAVGSFVEAVFVVDHLIVRRGVVLEVYSQRVVTVRGWDFESLCDDPRLIPDSELTQRDRDLIRSVLNT